MLEQTKPSQEDKEMKEEQILLKIGELLCHEKLLTLEEKIKFEKAVRVK